ALNSSPSSSTALWPCFSSFSASSRDSVVLPAPDKPKSHTTFLLIMSGSFRIFLISFGRYVHLLGKRLRKVRYRIESHGVSNLANIHFAFVQYLLRFRQPDGFDVVVHAFAGDGLEFSIKAATAHAESAAQSFVIDVILRHMAHPKFPYIFHKSLVYFG